MDVLESKIEKLSNEIYGENFKHYISEIVKENLYVMLPTIGKNDEVDHERAKPYRGDFAERKNAKYDIKSLQENLSSCFVEIQALKTLIIDMQKEILKKPNFDDVSLLDEKISELSPKSLVEAISKSISSLVEIKEFEDYKVKTEKFISNVETDYMNIAEISRKIDSIYFNLDLKLENYQTSEDASRVSARLNKRMNENDVNIGDIDSRLKFFKSQLKEIVTQNKKDFAEKATKTQLEEIRAEVAGKLSKTELIKGLNEANAKIAFIQKDITVLNRGRNELEQAILKIDEVLAEKPTKSDIREINNKISMITDFPDVAKEVRILENKLNSTSNHSESNEISINNLKLEMADIRDSLRETLDLDKESKFLKEFILEIQSELNNKAERDEILNYLEQKATCQDIIDLNDLIKLLHKQLKMVTSQIGVIQKNLFNINGLDKVQKDQFSLATQRIVETILNTTLENAKLPFLESFKTKLTLRPSHEFQNSRQSPQKRKSVDIPY